MDVTLDTWTSPVMRTSGFAPGSIIMKRYCVHCKLGSGSFATTYLVTDSRDAETQKVIKRIPCNSVKADATLPSAREAKLLGSLRHPFIVRFLGSFLENEDFCIVTEYCEGGDLHYHLQQQNDKGLAISEEHVMEWFIQLLLGVNYLHERLVMHRDLKTKNIFLKNGTLKIGDFGVSRVLVPSDLATTVTGTASYMSPEIFTQDGYNSKSDIWSLGCILHELCTFKHAFDCPKWIKLVSMIVNDPCPNLPSSYSAELNHILQRMLSKDPELRPSAKDILNFPYVADRAKVLAEWLQEVLSHDRQVSVTDDAARIADALEEKLHLDSLRAMRIVQEMAPRQRRRIRQEEQPETCMKKIKRAVERVYQENHQKQEDDRKYELLKVSTNAWMGNKVDLTNDEEKDVCGEEGDSEEEETGTGSVFTISLPLSEQQSNTLSAYQSCLRRFLDSSIETPGIQDTISPEEVTLTDCNEEEIAFLRQEESIAQSFRQKLRTVFCYLENSDTYHPVTCVVVKIAFDHADTYDTDMVVVRKLVEINDVQPKNCIQLLGEDGFREAYHFLKQVYNQEDQETLDLEEQTLCEPQVMKLYPQHCYKVQQLLFLEERMEKESTKSYFTWL